MLSSSDGIWDIYSNKLENIHSYVPTLVVSMAVKQLINKTDDV